MLMKTSTAIAALMLTTGVAQAQNLLNNSGFEAPVVGNACCETFSAPGSFPGWDVTAGDINVVAGTFSSSAGQNLAFEGSQYLDLIGQGTMGAISQTVATNVGRTYELTFAYSHNLFSGLASASAMYSVDGLSGMVTHSTGSNSNLDWQNFKGRFVATGGSSTLNFENTVSGTNAGVLLDGVSLAQVPEPATWAMMIAGFGVVGGALRRRRRTTVAFA